RPGDPGLLPGHELCRLPHVLARIAQPARRVAPGALRHLVESPFSGHGQGRDPVRPGPDDAAGHAAPDPVAAGSPRSGGTLMDISTATLLMVGAIFALLITGLPLAFITGLVAMAFTFGWFGETALPLVTSRVYGFIT